VAPAKWLAAVKAAGFSPKKVLIAAAIARRAGTPHPMTLISADAGTNTEWTRRVVLTLVARGFLLIAVPAGPRKPAVYALTIPTKG
jgi:hypothetical protein